MLPKSENRYTTYWKKKNFDPNFKSQVEKSIIDDEHSTRFENLIYRALSSGLITESKAADNVVVGAFAYWEKCIMQETT